jgi:ABC-type sulfate/molybdate transport systems ATPase subunit
MRISDRVAFLDRGSRSLLQIAPPEEMARQSPHRVVREFFDEKGYAEHRSQVEEGALP